MAEDAIITNETEAKHGSLSAFEKDRLFFWCGTAIYLCFALLAVVGNGLVLYVSLRNRNHGSLKHLDCVIQSLAVADMLYGLIGIPCRIFAAEIGARGVYNK